MIPAGRLFDTISAPKQISNKHTSDAYYYAYVEESTNYIHCCRMMDHRTRNHTLYEYYRRYWRCNGAHSIAFSKFQAGAPEYIIEKTRNSLIDCLHDYSTVISRFGWHTIEREASEVRAAQTATISTDRPTFMTTLVSSAPPIRLMVGGQHRVCARYIKHDVTREGDNDTVAINQAASPPAPALGVNLYAHTCMLGHTG